MSALDFQSLYADPAHASFQLGSGTRRALLVHGFMGTPAEMRHVGERLADAGWMVICELLPGFGRTLPQLPSTNTEDRLNTIRGAWRQLRDGAEQTALIGFSMGGALSLVLASETPPDRLVLMSPFTRFAESEARWLPLVRHFVKQIHPLENVSFDREDVRQQFTDLNVNFDLNDPATQNFLRENVALPTQALYELQKLGRRAVRAASSISAPTLIVQGSEDETVLPEATRRLIPLLAGTVDYREIPVGHEFPKMQGENPVPFAHLIEEFLSN